MRVALLFASFTLREAARKRLLLTLLLLSIVFVGLFLLGAKLLENRLLQRAIEAGSERPGSSADFARATLVLLGMYVVNFLGGLMGVFAAVGSVSGEIEAGTLLALAPKPVRRSQIVLGKWLGLSIIVLGYLSLLSGALLLGVRLVTGYTPPAPLAAVAVMDLAALFLLSLSVLGSTLLSTVANGVVVFLLYGLAWSGGLLQSVGQATDTPLMTRLGQASGVVVPSDTLWKGASFYLQPESLLDLQRFSRGVGNPFAGTEPPGLALIMWTGLLIVAALAGAMLVLERRDL